MKRLICGIGLVLLLAGAAPAREESAVHAEVLARSGLSWDGSSLPAYPQGAPEITVLRITIPPGVQLPLHRHPVINAGVLVQGELTVVTEDNRTLHLNAGDALVEVVDTWHSGRNEGTKTAVIVVFYAGVKESPITVEKKEPSVTAP